VVESCALGRVLAVPGGTPSGRRALRLAYAECGNLLLPLPITSPTDLSFACWALAASKRPEVPPWLPCCPGGIQ
jgi:hypothetical protein